MQQAADTFGGGSSLPERPFKRRRDLTSFGENTIQGFAGRPVTAESSTFQEVTPSKGMPGPAAVGAMRGFAGVAKAAEAPEISEAWAPGKLRSEATFEYAAKNFNLPPKSERCGFQNEWDPNVGQLRPRDEGEGGGGGGFGRRFERSDDLGFSRRRGGLGFGSDANSIPVGGGAPSNPSERRSWGGEGRQRQSSINFDDQREGGWGGGRKWESSTRLALEDTDPRLALNLQNAMQDESFRLALQPVTDGSGQELDVFDSKRKWAVEKYRKGYVNDAKKLCRFRFFVGGLHPEVTGAMMRKHFKMYAPVIDAHVAKEESGESRKFAFVTIGTDVEDVKRRILTAYHVIHGQRVEVREEASELDKQVHRRMFIGGVEQSVTEDDLMQTFLPYGQIDSVTVGTENNGENRGFAFITFTEESTLRRVLEAAAATPFEIHRKQVDLRKAETRAKAELREKMGTKKSQRKPSYVGYGAGIWDTDTTNDEFDEDQATSLHPVERPPESAESAAILPPAALAPPVNMSAAADVPACHPGMQTLMYQQYVLSLMSHCVNAISAAQVQALTGPQVPAGDALFVQAAESADCHTASCDTNTAAEEGPNADADNNAECPAIASTPTTAAAAATASERTTGLTAMTAAASASAAAGGGTPAPSTAASSAAATVAALGAATAAASVAAASAAAAVVPDLRRDLAAKLASKKESADIGRCVSGGISEEAKEEANEEAKEIENLTNPVKEVKAKAGEKDDDGDNDSSSGSEESDDDSSSSSCSD
eukprot:GHVU01209324.1.p1 GENE.GHVU01209324.1~~GHVU01209324.1.p1  ORF type:complete len:821 (-),score=153.85 GHVU01209324.1:340-2643(-)